MERHPKVIAATAELEAQMARAQVWREEIPARQQQLDFEKALAAEREEKARVEAAQRRQCVAIIIPAAAVVRFQARH